MEIENPNTLKSILQGPINLFLGAGFSTLAKDSSGQKLPLGNALAEELRYHFSLKQLDKLDLTKLCTIISSTHKQDFVDYLKRRFLVASFDPKYHVLENLLIETIFTTNIDNLIHKIFETSTKKYINDIDINGPVYCNRNAIEYVPLHGSILREDRPLRFGALDIASAFKEDPIRWYDLQLKLKKRPIIFVGYSLEDSGTLEVLKDYIKSAKGESNAWILLYPKNDVDALTNYFRALNLQIIKGTLEELLDFFAENVSVEERQGSQRTLRATEKYFPEECVPIPQKVMVRPIDHFFSGSPTTWSDIYSNVLYRTSYYTAIKELIQANSKVIITGIPVCGKTTLLMQLAASIDFKGHKLFVSKLTKERTNFIVRKLGRDPTLIFIDDYTDDAYSFNELSALPNISLVGASRDYDVSNTMHLIDKRSYSFINITELKDADLQGIRDSIPPRIRTFRMSVPQLSPLSKRVKSSIFEFIEANTTEPTLRDRVIRRYRELRTTNVLLAELLLVISYVEHCSIPFSMDMAIAYLRNAKLGYPQIITLFKNAGSSITEYLGDLSDEQQDYYVPRSRNIADAIIAAAGASSLKQMLWTFFRNISAFRICHYNVFARHAYDHEIILKAFHEDWEEAKAFYDMVYDKNPSPYILQHTAIYLSHCSQHKEAASYIDRALSEAGRYNWTIQNSHAVILFRANIEFWQDINAKVVLDESMEILRKCYTSDRRKAFHAKVFAEQAIEYWRRYQDANAREYLETARSWIKEERDKEPWLYFWTKLEREIQGLL